MTEDQRSDFYGVVLASYSLDERQLLRRMAELYDQALPFARNWTFANLPDYIFDLDTPRVEFEDLFATGIGGYFDFQFCDIHLKELTPELTEGDSEERPEP